MRLKKPKADRELRGEMGGMDMDDTDKAWLSEIDRRAKIYDDIEARGAWQGGMSAADYLGLLALSLLLVAGFWIWGH